jgi:hypothetical protein
MRKKEIGMICIIPFFIGLQFERNVIVGVSAIVG